MMTINNVIDCVTWLVCNLLTRDIFLNLSSKNETPSINFFCQGDILSNISKFYRVSNLRVRSWLKCQRNWPAKFDPNSKWVIWAWAKARGVCGFDLKMCLMKLCPLGRFRNYIKISFMGRMYTPHPACPKG